MCGWRRHVDCSALAGCNGSFSVWSWSWSCGFALFFSATSKFLNFRTIDETDVGHSFLPSRARAYFKLSLCFSDERLGTVAAAG